MRCCCNGDAKRLVRYSKKGGMALNYYLVIRSATKLNVGCSFHVDKVFIKTLDLRQQYEYINYCRPYSIYHCWSPAIVEWQLSGWGELSKVSHSNLTYTLRQNFYDQTFSGAREKWCCWTQLVKLSNEVLKYNKMINFPHRETTVCYVT